MVWEATKAPQSPVSEVMRIPQSTDVFAHGLLGNDTLTEGFYGDGILPSLAS